MAVLKGVGVGDSSATPLAATLTWMLKGTRAPCSCHIHLLNIHDCNAFRWYGYAGEDTIRLDEWVNNQRLFLVHTDLFFFSPQL